MGGGGRQTTQLAHQLATAVHARTPVDDRERVCIEQFLAELACRSDDDLFDEHANPVHVTTSGLIVGPRGVVLHRHRVLGTWVAPGGHIDHGEMPWEAELREVTEETGLAVRYRDGAPNLVHADVHPGPRRHTHLDLRYLLDGGDADPAPPPSESQEVAWFAWNDAIAVAEACMSGILLWLSARA